MRENLDPVPLWQLLDEFWTYYQSDGEGLKNELMISINGRKEKHESMTHHFCIVDPFDVNHDPGKRSEIDKPTKTLDLVFSLFQESPKKIRSEENIESNQAELFSERSNE